MKALFTSAVGILLLTQISCATGPGARVASKNPLDDQAALAGAKMGSTLATPEVAVMPMKEGVLIAWKPVDDADGYFVYRESNDSKKLLGIGPKEAQGFIDRNPPETSAKYSVQAFKLSELSEKRETQALPGTTRQSRTHLNEPGHTSALMKASFPM